MSGFFDGGSKSLSFGDVGDTTWLNRAQGGLIVNIGEARQATDWDTKEPKVWPKSKDPVITIPVTLDTNQGDYPSARIDDEDDGVRDLYIDKGTGRFRAVQAALRAAKEKDLVVGGRLYIAWTSGVGKKGDPRQYQAQYIPPVATSGGMFSEPEQPAAVIPPPAANGFPAQMPAQQAPAPRFDPHTGQPLAPVQTQAAPPEGPKFDPATGAPMNDAARAVLAGGQQQATPAPAAAATNPFKRE